MSSNPTRFIQAAVRRQLAPLSSPLGSTHLRALSELLHDNAMALVKSDNSTSIFIGVALDLVLEKWNIGLDKSPNNTKGEDPYPEANADVMEESIMAGVRGAVRSGARVHH